MPRNRPCPTVDDYLYEARLIVADPLDAGLAWDGTGNPAPFGCCFRSALFQHRLDGGGALPALVAPHLRVHVPEHAWCHDHVLFGGARAVSLAAGLIDRLTLDTELTLPSGMEARVAVVPDGTLVEGELALFFGPGLYLPGPEEKVSARFNATIDGSAACRWGVLFRDQRIAVLGDPALGGGVGVSGWPFDPEAALLAYVDDTGQIGLEPLPAGALAVSIEERDPDRVRYTISDNAGHRVFLEVARGLQALDESSYNTSTEGAATRASGCS